MARGDGFLKRIGRALRNVVAPPRREPPRREPSPPPREREPARPSVEYRRIWRDARGKGDYRKNLDVFHNAVDPIESDPAERLELWESYIRNINRGQGRFRRQSNENMFWRDSGIDPASEGFDWRAWREAMGYTGKRRSKTA